MALTQINWKPDAHELRKFALTLMIGFTLLAWLAWWWKGFGQASREAGSFVWGPLPWLWGIPMAVGLVSLIHRRIAMPFYLVWMGIAFVMGTVLGYTVLAIFFYGIITPTGLLLRLSGRDPLRLRRHAKTGNWVDHPRPTTKESCERLF